MCGKEPPQVAAHERLRILPGDVREQEQEHRPVELARERRRVVGRELPDGHQVLEHRALDGQGLLHEHEAERLRGLLVGVAARGQQPAQPDHVPVREEVPEPREHPPLRLLERPGVPVGVLGRRGHNALRREHRARALQLRGQNRVEDGLLAREVVVERRVLDAHRRRDVAHGDGMVPPLREQPERRLDDPTLRVPVPHASS